ncbi:hypothetical protein MARINOS108_10492 [Marinoscillum sp. 108]|nr:hypothetical protein MARINOS108_10492 [Marinoscillum sp. 108]
MTHWLIILTNETCFSLRYKEVHKSTLPHPCASSRFIAFVRTSLTSITHFLHRTARVARYSIPQNCIPYRATLAFPNAHPNAGKAVFVSRSVLFRKNISARVQ